MLSSEKDEKTEKESVAVQNRIQGSEVAKKFFFLVSASMKYSLIQICYPNEWARPNGFS